MFNTPRASTTQAASASPAPNVINVVDAKTNYQFMMAISEAGLPDKAYRIAQRLSLHFNCRTGLCNPGEDVLMYKLGISKSTLYRALDYLKHGGFLTSKRRGPDGNVEFTLFIPISVPVTQVAAVTASDPTSIGVIQVTPIAADSYVSDLASIGVKNDLHRFHHADTSENNGTMEQKRAATPPAPRRVDRPVSTEPAVTSTDPARAYSALTDVYAVDFDDLSEDDAEQLLQHYLRNGESFAEITNAAQTYMRQVTETGGTVMMIRDWLKAAPWKARQ